MGDLSHSFIIVDLANMTLELKTRGSLLYIEYVRIC